MNCPNCGKDFEPLNGRFKYCSENCRYEMKKRYSLEWAKNKRMKKIPIRVCECCEKPFESSRARKYCSKECRDAMYYGVRLDVIRTKPKQKKKIMSLAEVNRLAREAGMTYGQYMVAMNK